MPLTAVISLLQTALVLLTLVSGHPEISQSLRDATTQVAQQAITQATLALSDNTGSSYSPSAIELRGECWSFSRDFALGATDAEVNGDVSKLQRFLIDGGWLMTMSVPDGDFGHSTSDALQKWQWQHDIPVTTPGIGTVGPRTRAILGMQCNQGGPIGDRAGINGAPVQVSGMTQ